jgi:Fe(3+) dicitrate transport protein
VSSLTLRQERNGKNFMSSLQLTYVSAQFTEASNSKIDTNDNTTDIWRNPFVYIFSASYKWKSWKLERRKLTLLTIAISRRATGYPGPGIIPFTLHYTTLELKDRRSHKFKPFRN